VHDGAVHGPDLLGEVEVGGGHAAVGDGLGQRDVRRGDQRGRRVALRVGEAGEQVVGGAGVGDVQVAVDADGDEEGVVGWAGKRSRAGRAAPRGVCGVTLRAPSVRRVTFLTLAGRAGAVGSAQLSWFTVRSRAWA
jgi:hypothetical protein